MRPNSLAEGPAVGWRFRCREEAVSDLDHTLLRRVVGGILAPFDRPGSPGVTIGIVRGRELVLHESAGLASVELGVPIGPGTTFRIASVSKQFTCAVVLMLAEEGVLSLGDDIRLHVPELADFGHVVTIDHLMHNTSGIRDMLEIMRIGGCDLAMPVGRDALLAGIARQTTLNFPPGSRYLYSNSAFLLLGVIAERVSGMALRALLAARIFGPCGMAMTGMVESTDEVVPGLAGGYLPADAGRGVGAWVRAQHGFALGGEGALVSSVVDLALWHRACVTNSLGPNLAVRLEHCAPFTGGAMNDYARGLRVSAVRGVRTVSHGGLWPGFKTEFLRVPELDAAIIVAANNAAANPYAIGQQVLGHLLDGVAGVPRAPGLPAVDVLVRHVGRFLDPVGLATVDFSLSGDGVLSGSCNGVSFAVRATGDGRLAAATSARDFCFRLSADGDSMAIEQGAGEVAIWRRVAPGAALPAGLAGRYRSAEMAATWTISADSGGMAVAVAGPVAHAGPWPVEAVAEDVIRVWMPGALYRSWLDVRVVRDGGGAIGGLLANGNRVKNLAFARLDEG